MSKSVSVILNLDDKLSAPLIKTRNNIEENLKKMSKAERREYARAHAAEIEAAKAEEKRYKNLLQNLRKAEAAVKKVTAAAAAVTFAGIAAGLKVGFSTGSELETLRQNIETVTKSAERAGEVMEYAVNMANFSAFDNSQLIEAAATLETYGMTTEKYLRSVGDAAAITGKDIGNLSKAFGKAVVSGQFDSLADIGITRDTLDQYAKSQGVSLFSGTKIKDKDQFAAMLAQFMDSRYAGGMEKQASTLKGMFSTIKGMASNTLATIVGVPSRGEIVAGGAMDRVRQKVQGLMDTIAQMQADGRMQQIADKAASALSVVVSVGEGVIRFLTNPAVVGVAGWIGGIVLAVGVLTKTLTAVRAVITAVQIAQTALNLAWAISPVGLIVAGIAAIVAGLVILYKKCEGFRNFVNWIGEKIGGFFKWLFGGGKDDSPDLPSGKTVPQYASGTHYHTGGLALVGERGPELVSLPGGSSVTPNSTTRNFFRGTNTINIYITGAQRSDEEIAETVAEKLMEALDNI